jgi:hypothetical protein
VEIICDKFEGDGLAKERDRNNNTEPITISLTKIVKKSLSEANINKDLYAFSLHVK